MRSIPLLLFITLLAALVAAPGADATPAFPEGVRGHLALDFTPQCQLCHTDAGNIGTATQPFALSMLERGLLAFDVESLELALDAMEADGVDSDGDGVTDVDELRDGLNPNLENGGGEDAAPTLEYGFGCSGAPGPADAAVAGLLALGVRRARRRRPIPRHRSEAY